MTTPDIFLSYNREDTAVAKRFADVCSPNFNPKNGHSASHPIQAIEIATKRTHFFKTQGRAGG